MNNDLNTSFANISLEDNNEYKTWLEDIKKDIQQAQVRTSVKANSELIMLYWNLGKSIVYKQSISNWGDGLIKQLSKDLINSFPNIKGFSERNLSYIKQWYSFYKDNILILQQAVAELETEPISKKILEFYKNKISENETSLILQQPVAELEAIDFELIVTNLLSFIPWGHNIYIITKCKDFEQALFYLIKTIENNWSRSVLIHQFESNLFDRQGKAINNFELTLPPYQSELANELLKDPYIFDFITIKEKADERNIENQLTSHITKFLLELGTGFAFLGRQYHIKVSDKDFYIDLLFYNVRLRAYFVIELKAVEFEPAFAGQVNFYLSAIDDLLKSEYDNPSIGLILCKTKDKIIAEYALRNQKQPIGVAEYKIVNSIPDDLKSTLPSINDIEKSLMELESSSKE